MALAIGYKVISGGRVHEARSLEEAADFMALFYPAPCRASARVTLTQDRRLTAPEVYALADLTAAVLTGADA